ncbi:MAG TPA: outer membrane protein assembly factor BamB [Gammaproteobacteria bacterium]
MRHAFLGITLLLAGGCSTVGDYMSGDDSDDSPAALAEFEASLQLQQLWSSDAGAGSGNQGMALTVAIDGDHAYTADHQGRVTALALADGRKRWSTDTDLQLSGGPGVGSGRVVVGTLDAELLALAADDGKEQWRARVSSEVLAPPQVGQGVVVVFTVDGRLAAHDADTGARLWLYDSVVPVLSLRGTSTPLISGDAVLAGFANGKLAALGLRDGRLLWETSVAVPRGRSELERMVDIDGAPVVSAGTVYAASYQGRIAAMSLQSGTLLWSREVSSYTGLGAAGNKVFLSDDSSHVWALDSANGAAYWRQEGLFARRVTAPVAVGDSVVVGDLQGYLHFMAIEDGRFLARIKVGDRPIVATPLVVGDTVYALDSGGRLVAVRVGAGG